MTFASIWSFELEIFYRLYKTSGRLASARGEYTPRVAKTIEEARQLIEQGFDYITEIENIKIFRRRK
jgi:hypothetical protein